MVAVLLVGAACAGAGIGLWGFNQVQSWVLIPCRSLGQVHYACAHSFFGVLLTAAYVNWQGVPATDLRTGHELEQVTSWWFGLLGLWVMAAVTLVLVSVDLQSLRLPRSLVIRAGTVSIVCLELAAAVAHHYDRMLLVCEGAVMSWVWYSALSFASPGSIGQGDTRLAPFMGAVLGNFGRETVIVGVVVAFFLGGIVAALVRVLCGRGYVTHAELPLGVCMLSSAWGVTLLFMSAPKL